ncbi:MAG: universal stress protein [Arenicella sp.]|nr:universal stress protein [Arenicella sp.]
MIKRVLVYLYGDLSHSTVIRSAAAFATQHGALLTGLFIKPDIMNYATVYGEYPLNLAQSFVDLQKSYADKAEAEFNSITGDFDCNTQWHTSSEVEGQLSPAMYADLLFVTQPRTESSVVFNDADFTDNLIMDTGLPTIVVPEDWEAEKFGAHPMLGWKPSKEVVGAVRHSLSLMRGADKVDIVSVVRKQDKDRELIDGVEISAYLSAHGVQCEFFTETFGQDEKNEADALRRHADEQGCDLMIIGGYGHSRFREVVLGGVTRSLLRQSQVPVLVSH